MKMILFLLSIKHCVIQPIRALTRITSDPFFVLVETPTGLHPTEIFSGEVCQNRTDLNLTVCHSAPETKGIRELLLFTHPDPSQRLPSQKRAPSSDGKLSILATYGKHAVIVTPETSFKVNYQVVLVVNFSG